MDNLNLKIEYIDVDKLTPYERNTRKHTDKDIDIIAKSIEKYGFNDAIGIWGKNATVVEGHGRLLAAKKLGMEKVPCVRLDHLTEQERKEYAIAHNRSAEMSEWDFDILPDELEGLDFEGFDFGFDFDFGDEKDKEIIEDEPPEVDEDKEPICKLGDIWQLGNHKLLCGDSTDRKQVERLMNGEKADMVFTDPPYGMKKENEGIINDNLNYDDLLEFNKKWIPISLEFTKDNGSWYCFGIDEPLMDIYSEIIKPLKKDKKENRITFRNLITWDKGSGQGQLSADFRMYPIADEKILFIMKGEQGFNNNADNYFEGWEPIREYLNKELKKIGVKRGSQFEKILGSVNKSQHILSKSHFNLITEKDYKKLQKYAVQKGEDAFKREYDDIKREYDDIKREYDDIKREYYATRAYFDNTHDNMNNVWHFSKTSAEERKQTGGHATPKPIALCCRAIKTSSRDGETVLDLFGGSGSTLIACEQLGRKCYMMELSEKYCDVILQRWEQFTGKKAVLLND